MIIISIYRLIIVNPGITGYTVDVPYRKNSLDQELHGAVSVAGSFRKHRD